jgi:hypothetical protein
MKEGGPEDAVAREQGQNGSTFATNRRPHPAPEVRTLTKERRYYQRHRDEVLKRARAKYRSDPRVRIRIVRTNRKRIRMERLADRWISEWLERKAA